jgi:hypothetical protein
LVDADKLRIYQTVPSTRQGGEDGEDEGNSDDGCRPWTKELTYKP